MEMNHYGWGNIDNLGKGEETFATSTKKEKRHIVQDWRSTMNRQLLNLYGPIPGMTPAEGLIAIQTMTDHSQKGNDGSPTQTVCSSNNSERMVAIASKLDNIETQIEQLTKEVHAKASTKVLTSSVGQCKEVYDDAPINKESSNKTNEIYGVSFIDKQEDDNLASEGLPC
ncbi:hypothetical protein Tco_0572317 [Tanacetum coccineum]